MAMVRMVRAIGLK